MRPDGLYPTKPAGGGNKAPKLQAIRDALKTAKRVWLATDCDREGQLIGQEILEHYGYKGEVRRVMFTAQDAQTIREAFSRARPAWRTQGCWRPSCATPSPARRRPSWA